MDPRYCKSQFQELCIGYVWNAERLTPGLVWCWIPIIRWLQKYGCEPRTHYHKRLYLNSCNNWELVIRSHNWRAVVILESKFMTFSSLCNGLAGRTKNVSRKGLGLLTNEDDSCSCAQILHHWSRPRTCGDISHHACHPNAPWACSDCQISVVELERLQISSDWLKGRTISRHQAL